MRLTDLVKTVDDYDTLVARLDYLSTPEPNTGCLLWLGGTTQFGHGMIRTQMGVIGAHVLAYLLHVDHVPKGFVVRHKCDQPSCINFEHLVIGTQLENMRDKQVRGRDAHQRVLSVNDRAYIRSVYKRGQSPSMKDLGEQFGVSAPAIYYVLNERIERNGL